MVTLAEELPFAAVADDRYIDQVCSSCFVLKALKPLYRCIGCQVLHYCSRECQKKDWINHKQECPLLKKLSPDVPNDKCRLVARIIFKLKRPGANDAAFNGRRYEDLMENRENIQKNVLQSTLNGIYSKGLRAYLGDELLPKQDVLQSIFGKVTTNAFAISDEMEDIGSGLYIGISVHDHSCAPDAYRYFDGPKAILRSPNKDLKYSKDLTITYTDILQTKVARQGALLAGFYFTCTCSVCSDETREFLENSAYSTCCPDSYCLLDPNASQLTCFNCGSPSKVTTDEATAAIQELKTVMQGSKTGKSAPEQEMELRILIEKYDRLSKILSPFNMNLLHVNDRLSNLALSLGNSQILLKYTPYILPAYRKYLSVGNPQFTCSLLHVAKGLSCGPKPNKETLALFEEAYAAALISHGPVAVSTKVKGSNPTGRALGSYLSGRVTRQVALALPRIQEGRVQRPGYFKGAFLVQALY